jgi:hypothetical protein
MDYEDGVESGKLRATVAQGSKSRLGVDINFEPKTFRIEPS